MSPTVASTDSMPHLLDALVKEDPNAPMLIDAATGRRVTRAQFDQKMSEHMPKFMVPKYLEILPAFPRTPATERIQKSALRALAPGLNQWDRMKSTQTKTTA